MSSRSFLLGIAAASLFTSACRPYDEGITIENIVGKVFVPVEAATREFVRTDDEGNEIDVETVTDPALIGPVYIGAYSGVVEGEEPYPHPLRGPQFREGVDGDTYPYGGTTVGDIRYACFEFLACKVSSGRFVDFDQIVSWFGDTIGTPITDAAGNEVTNGDVIRQTCYEFLEVTSDRELRLTAEDRNNDGEVNKNDLDFVLDNSGDYFVGEFTLWQQEHFTDPDEGVEGGPKEGTTGMSLWAFMDSPSDLSFQFSTCNPAEGYQENNYNNNFFGGKQFEDVLNLPSQYITRGDWVSCTDKPRTGTAEECAGTQILDPLSTEIEIYLDWEVE